MKKKKMRIKVAELLGWKHIRPQRLTTGSGQYKTGKLYGSLRDDECECSFVPNYPEDLNACYEMEKALEMFEVEQYQCLLVNLIRGVSLNEYSHWSDVGSWFITHATAKQKCVAFLKVKGISLEDLNEEGE